MDPFLLCAFHVCLCHTVLSVPCSLAVTCWERADLLALLFVMFACVFFTFPHGTQGQVWYSIVSIPDLCFLTSLDIDHPNFKQLVRQVYPTELRVNRQSF